MIIGVNLHSRILTLVYHVVVLAEFSVLDLM